MSLPRAIVALLADWRSMVTRTTDTTAGSAARSNAERAERRAKWAYEDESLRQHDAHGRPESPTRRINRLGNRGDTLRRDRQAVRDRPKELADEAEFERELGERG